MFLSQIFTLDVGNVYYNPVTAFGYFEISKGSLSSNSLCYLMAIDSVKMLHLTPYYKDFFKRREIKLCF